MLQETTTDRTSLQHLSAYLIQAVCDHLGVGFDVDYTIDAKGERLTVGPWELAPPAVVLFVCAVLEGDAYDDPDEWLAEFCDAHGTITPAPSTD